jgi:phosphatidylserine decarboxylase
MTYVIINRKTQEQEKEIIGKITELGIYIGKHLGEKELKSFSQMAGAEYDKPISPGQIEKFVQYFNIRMEDYEPGPFPTFNAFFTRGLRPGARRVSKSPNVLCSPADSRCVVYTDMKDAQTFWIKGDAYTFDSMVTKTFASILSNPMLAIFRLAPQDYHRFHSPLDGKVVRIKKVDGFLYSVNPSVVQSNVPVFSKNKRVILELKSPKFGKVIMVIVGATAVGSIVLNVKKDQKIKKGDQVGLFKFGGSTVILCLEKGSVLFDLDLRKASQVPIETLVRMGEKIGK